MVPLFSMMDVYAHPSLTGEGFPNVVAESMLCELPVVAADVAETRGVLGSANICVAAGEFDAFVAGLDQIVELGNESMRSIGVSNRAHIRALYDIDAVAKQYVAAFTGAGARRSTCVA